MSVEHFRIRKIVATLVSVAALSMAVQTSAFADGEDDDFEISPVCRAKPWLPVCDPPESPSPPPQLPFPCDFLASGCPWWYFD
jgi:hypothetical protein